MVVNQSGGLHEGITYGATNESKAAFLQILRHGIGNPGVGRHLRAFFPVVLQWLSVDKIPQVLIQRIALFAQLEIGACVLDEAVDLEPVANDTCILQQICNFCFTVARYLVGIEIVEYAPVIFSLAQDRDPA